MSTDPAADQAAEYVPEKVKKAEKKLEENPYDLDAWSILIREAQNQPIDKARKTYERLVTQFPSSGRFWKLFIEAEVKAKNYDRVEKLFQRCLMKVLHIDLWKCYLAYVRETKGKLPSYKEKMAQAYDFALDKIGMEIMSYQIWVDYINFLKGVEAVGSYAENQRITAVRRVYQRGCVNPMINIEQLWRDYSKYEEGINIHLAKKMIEDRSRDYMNARRVAKEYETVMKGLDRNAPSVPPQNSPQEAQQVDMWKKYIQWEKSNPLRTEDQTLITKRVMFAYEQCLLVLGHHPDVWYESAQYLEQSSKLLAEKGDINNSKLFSDEAANIYERAIGTLLKKNMLLYFSFADYEESRMKHEKVHNIYNKLLAIEDIDPTLVYIQYMKFARRAEGIKSGRTIFKKAREDLRTRHHVYVTAALMEYYCSKDKSVAFKIFELGLKKYGDIPEYILAYIDYLSHLNEDNNTRVLFERVLTSGNLSPEKSGEIWARFLAFESNIGDLASILKVERRRFTAFKEEYEGKETALLVDRYKFMDLYPCSTSELKALGYKDVTRAKLPLLPETVAVPSAPTLKDEIDRRPEYPKPDINQMIPFQPRHMAPPGLHPVPGGVFPVPPVAVLLMKLLPPPTCFTGPFVQVDELIETFRRCTLPETVEAAVELITGRLPDGSGEGNGAVENHAATKSLKRPNADSDEEDDKGVAPPIHDIYRARQQKRIR
ncbi:cleavage stimulation factor subunit 3 [Corythoichthys intestinalis]|uniref:cleavage stimulation factor subunit 3 n=1 Tax=Corythoichthys intestinalis TaxID=161448 RepID=UPI0025A4DF45|nr:cleavage stimulation factor subunit 3 [Corythoichthys intestinalis]XP_061796261.1 cleavage stimulation factor subunit 3-like [Nerophis lumbriciformis]